MNKFFKAFSLGLIGASVGFATMMAAPAPSHACNPHDGGGPLCSVFGNMLAEEAIGGRQVDLKCRMLTYDRAQHVGHTASGMNVYRCVGGGNAPSAPFTFKF